MLNQYINEVQLLLNDPGGQMFTPEIYRNYINRARRRVAGLSGCIRVMPLGTRTHKGQEIYPFSDWISLVQGTQPGIQSILYCRSVAIAAGSPQAWKPMWRRIVWTDFQARFRVYNSTFFGTFSEPGWWAQYGAGPAGAIFLAPIPAQSNIMEVDLTCIPQPLLDDSDSEPIPYPWTDAVAYWAAVLALFQQQRPQDAKIMAELFGTDMPMCAAIICPEMIQSAYAGGIKRSA